MGTLADQASVRRGGAMLALLSVGGLVGAVASAPCCLLPVALLTLGVSGAWIGRLTALAPYQPVFVVLALVSLGAGFARVYRQGKAACDPGARCALPPSRTAVKAALWVATILVVAALAAPYAIGRLFNS